MSGSVVCVFLNISSLQPYISDFYSTVVTRYLFCAYWWIFPCNITTFVRSHFKMFASMLVMICHLPCFMIVSIIAFYESKSVHKKSLKRFYCSANLARRLDTIIPHLVTARFRLLWSPPRMKWVFIHSTCTKNKYFPIERYCIDIK